MFFICLRGVNLQQRMVEFWGMFFICLWGVNLQQKMVEFWSMFFICLCGCEFTAKNGWILRHDFHMFAGCEFMAKNGWISKYFFHMFAGCEFLMKNRCFKVHFSYIYGVNFLQKLDDSYCIVYLCYWSTSINYGPLASIINPPNYTLNLIKINNHNRSCILIEATVEAGSRSTI